MDRSDGFVLEVIPTPPPPVGGRSLLDDLKRFRGAPCHPNLLAVDDAEKLPPDVETHGLYVVTGPRGESLEQRWRRGEVLTEASVVQLRGRRWPPPWPLFSSAACITATSVRPVSYGMKRARPGSWPLRDSLPAGSPPGRAAHRRRSAAPPGCPAMCTRRAQSSPPAWMPTCVGSWIKNCRGGTAWKSCRRTGVLLWRCVDPEASARCLATDLTGWPATVPGALDFAAAIRNGDRFQLRSPITQRGSVRLYQWSGPRPASGELVLTRDLDRLGQQLDHAGLDAASWELRVAPCELLAVGLVVVDGAAAARGPDARAQRRT